MKRVKDIAAIALAATLAVSALLTACSRGTPPAAGTQAPGDAHTAVAADGMPEIVITAQREGARNIVLSARGAGPVSK